VIGGTCVICCIGGAGGGGVYGVAGLGVIVSRVNAGGAGGGDARKLELFPLIVWCKRLPHSSQYSEPSRLSVAQL
jgi:hypothetical protein